MQSCGVHPEALSIHGKVGIERSGSDPPKCKISSPIQINVKNMGSVKLVVCAWEEVGYAYGWVSPIRIDHRRNALLGCVPFRLMKGENFKWAMRMHAIEPWAPVKSR